MYQVYSLTNSHGHIVYVGRMVIDDPKSVKRANTRFKTLESQHGELIKKAHLETTDIKAASNLAQTLNSNHRVYDLRDVSNARIEVVEPVVKVRRRQVVCGDGYPSNAFLVHDGTQLIRSRS